MNKLALTPEQAAYDIAEEFYVKDPPVNIMQIAQTMGFTVLETDLSAYEEVAGYRISGMIEAGGGENPRKLIYVNSKEHEGRKNFTIAHELGHYILHMDKEKDEIITSFRGSKDVREREADMFASELLMPTELVLIEYYKTIYPTVRQLSKKFEVSEAAMRYKLDRLGLNYIG